MLWKSSGRMGLASRQQFGPVAPVPQRVEFQRHRRPKPQGVDGGIIDHILGHEMNKNVETLAVEHQPRHEALELRRLENDVELRHRVRTPRFIAKATKFDSEFVGNRVSYTFGNWTSGRIEIDMGVIPNGVRHRGPSYVSSTLWCELTFNKRAI